MCAHGLASSQLERPLKAWPDEDEKLRRHEELRRTFLPASASPEFILLRPSVTNPLFLLVEVFCLQTMFVLLHQYLVRCPCLQGKKPMQSRSQEQLPTSGHRLDEVGTVLVRHVLVPYVHSVDLHSCLLQVDNALTSEARTRPSCDSHLMQ